MLRVLKVMGMRVGVVVQVAVVLVLVVVVVVGLVDVLRVVEVDDVLLVVVGEPPLPEPTMAISAQVR